MTRTKGLKWIGIAIAIILTAGIGYQVTRTPEIDFNQDIRPILNNKCMRCHGGVKRSGGLSLLFRSEALLPNESGLPAIVPGDPGTSEMITRIKHTDPELRMPLDGEALTEEEIVLLEKWIASGAEWETHWAYIPPQKPEIPSVDDKSWPQSPIDHFIGAKMDKKGLTPNPEAKKEQLYRRVSLDLIGLPPTWEEVQQFVQDSSVDAYEKLVDRLLQSPRFGEHLASMWLDLARYADSKGYEKDPYRNIWPYRDWVIKAFNNNKPFDEFTIEQLAGDLLANPTQNQLVATAFHRNTMNNTEGGTEDEEYRVASVLDRVNTTWTIWQGTTMECVQCHSHPYDPFLQKEYYQLYDYYNQTQDADLDGEFPVLSYFREDSTIENISAWIQLQSPDLGIDLDRSLNSQIRNAAYPLLIPGNCDDFNDVRIAGDGSVDNWATNPNNIPDKDFFFVVKGVDLTEVSAIGYAFSSVGNQGVLEVRLNDTLGTILQKIEIPKAQKGFVSLPISSQNGKHDLYFRLYNKQVNAPEGRFSIRYIYLQNPDQPLTEKEREKRYEIVQKLRKAATKVPIMKTRLDDNERITQEFDRGNWMVKGDTVEAAIPHSLVSDSSQIPSDRLEMAAWLVSSENPLAARVIVNRFWAELFGVGLVETTEDFGTQGMKPTHPELLDWLAVYFRDELDWDVKALLKTLVMSATYRQSAVADKQKLAQDPANTWLARGPRVRLKAEQVRDQTLAVSGLLSDKMYGPPVMPPQPDNVWQVVYSGMQWETATGEDRYRRAIYTYWRRTSPYPSMIAFDAPSREFCVSRRISTNTPLQALVTLNDTVYVEAAMALAQRMQAQGETLSKQIRSGYEHALLESPDDETLNTLVNLYHTIKKERTGSQQLPELRIEQVSDNDDAILHQEVLTVVASAILNLDSFLMKQ